MKDQKQELAASLDRLTKASNRRWEAAREEDENYQGQVSSSIRARRTAIKRTLALLALSVGKESVQHAVVVSRDQEWFEFVVITDTLVIHSEPAQPAELNPKVTVTSRKLLRKLTLSERFDDQPGGGWEPSGALLLHAEYEGGVLLNIDSSVESGLRVEPILETLSSDLAL